ncbi:TPA: hypothetical protein ACTYSP_004267 [Citrobacter freundii]
MIRHILLIAFIEKASVEQIANVEMLFLSMPKYIPGIISVE